MSFMKYFFNKHCLSLARHYRHRSPRCRGCYFLAAILTLGFISPGWSDDDDWRRLHEDVQAGKIKPLNEILASLNTRYDGQVIDVDLEDENGVIIYEIELLGPQGQVVEFDVNAATGELIGIEGSNIRGMTRP
tara:strand:- start:622 stop:1020 length:399 start_codon:yes stop_codon:yes gene_type:complete